MLKHGILGLLNYGDMTGYEIKTAFEDYSIISGMHRPVRSTENFSYLKRTAG